MYWKNERFHDWVNEKISAITGRREASGYGRVNINQDEGEFGAQDEEN